MSGAAQNSYNAYRKANYTVAKTRQVVMLYDGIIRNLMQASDAIEQNKVETRFNKLVRASEIVVGLQACLDFESGGSAAQVLYDFYSSVYSRITNLQRTNDRDMCAQLISEIREMRDMWDKIDKGEIKVVTADAALPDSTQSDAPAEQAADGSSSGALESLPPQGVVFSA